MLGSRTGIEGWNFRDEGCVGMVEVWIEKHRRWREERGQVWGRRRVRVRGRRADMTGGFEDLDMWMEIGV